LHFIEFWSQGVDAFVVHISPNIWSGFIRPMYVRVSLNIVNAAQFSYLDKIIYTWNNQFNLGCPVASASLQMSHGRYPWSSPCPSGYAHVKCLLVLDRVFASISSSFRVLRRCQQLYCPPAKTLHSQCETSFLSQLGFFSLDANESALSRPNVCGRFK
jgi:hypothetical protein